MDRNFTDVLEQRIDTTQAGESRTELSASVEKLSQVFASYNLNPELARCTDCVTVEDELRVHSKPLVQLLPAELEKYDARLCRHGVMPMILDTFCLGCSNFIRFLARDFSIRR